MRDLMKLCLEEEGAEDVEVGVSRFYEEVDLTG